jgi:hypothetical protein
MTTHYLVEQDDDGVEIRYRLREIASKGVIVDGVSFADLMNELQTIESNADEESIVVHE